VVCGVVDGADWCQQFLDVHRLDAVRILDFSHAAGYLAQIAQAAQGEGSVAAATWYEAQRHALKHDPTPDAVLAAVRAVRDDLTTRRMVCGAVAIGATGTGTTGTGTTATPASLATVTKGLTYLEKRQAQLQYASFREQGYPIGSGIVESANKTVVEARLKGAGMHWDRRHVNPMLALRTVACADRWDEAWPQILRQVREQQRPAPTACRATKSRRPCVPILSTPSTTTPPPQPPHPPLSYGPGRPAADHPWKRRFLPTRSAPLAQNAKS